MCTLSEARDADAFKGEAACVLSNTLKAGGCEAILGKRRKLVVL